MIKSKKEKRRLIGGCLDVTTMIEAALGVHWWSEIEIKRLAAEAEGVYWACLRPENIGYLRKMLEQLPINKRHAGLAVVVLRTIATALIATGREDSFFMLIGASASTSWCPDSQRCFQLQALGLIPGYLESIRKQHSPLSFKEIVYFRQALSLIFGEAEFTKINFDFSAIGFGYWEGSDEKRTQVCEQDFIYLEWIIENFNLTTSGDALRAKGLEVALKGLVADYQIPTVASELDNSRLVAADVRLRLIVDKYLGYRRQTSNNLMGTSLGGLFFQVLQQGLARARFAIVLDVLDQFFNSSYWHDFNWWLSFDHNPRLLCSLKQGLKLMCHQHRQYDRDLVACLPRTLVRLFGYPNRLDIDEVSKLLYQVLEAVYRERGASMFGDEDWLCLLEYWQLDAWETLGLDINNITYPRIIDRLQELGKITPGSDPSFWILMLTKSESCRKLLATCHDNQLSS